MTFLAELWLPILLSAVAVFVVSSIFHMAIPIHKNDYGRLANEDDLLASMRQHGVKPGTYMFPSCASMKDLGTPEMQKKYADGPVGWMTVLPNGPFRMGPSLIAWFLYSLLIGLFVAYIARATLEPGAAYLAVFRVAGAAAVLGYAFSAIPDSVWKGQKWSVTGKFVFDGVVYGLVTAGVFAWLWPAAA